MSQSTQPYTPLQHCPQCDGAIDPRCMRTEPMRRSHNPFPRRRTEAWCTFCNRGFTAVTELQGTEWKLLGVSVAQAGYATRLRQYAEQQMGTIQRKAS